MATITEITDQGNDTLTATQLPFGDEFLGGVGFPDGANTDTGDWFSFSGDAVVSFDLTNLTDDIDLELYSWDGVTLTKVAESYHGYGENEHISFNTDSTLDYFLAVVPYQSAASSYTLTSVFDPVATSVYGDGPENVLGGNGRDEMFMNGGSDVAYGRGGSDTLWGGNGRDFLYGEADADLLSGDAGNDRLNGGSQNDTLYGGIGDDSLIGGTNDDALSGEDGDDTLDGGSGLDTLFGGYGDDTMRGGTGNDYMDGDFGTDVLYGDDGDDHLIINDGDDSAYGGNGADRIDVFNVAGWVNGEAGNDILVGDALGDTLRGGKGDDVIYGGDGDNSLQGDLGDDFLQAGTGNDLLIAGVGHDTLVGGRGTDTVQLGITDLAEDVIIFMGEVVHDDLTGTDAYAIDLQGDSVFGFEAGFDIIDLYYIDANLTRLADQRFIFNGTSGARANALWYSAVGGDTVVSLDITGDAVADGSFTLMGFTGVLTRGDFVL